jgi:UDP-N-acetylglucosamine 4,6-dehydratase/5-epimerase
MSFLKNKKILVTGATGSFGNAFVNEILKSHYDINKIIVFSRDELKQTEMRARISPSKLKKVRFFLGDIRDLQRLNWAFKEVDIIVHAAALKHVPVSEYNPTEFIKTNIIGSQNIVEASLNNNVKNVIALSTDKAVSPLNLYGATKLVADKLFTSANLLKGKNKIKFSVVRYGNVFGSRGSVIPLFLKLKTKDAFPITDLNMTRFNISLSDSVKLVLWSLKNNLGGEIFVPKIPSYRILDLAKSIKENFKYTVIGIRPGEKIHEELISKADSLNTYDLKYCYSIIDSVHSNIIKKYKKDKIKKIKAGYQYNSLENKAFLSVSELRKLVKIYKQNYNL